MSIKFGYGGLLQAEGAGKTAGSIHGICKDRCKHIKVLAAVFDVSNVKIVILALTVTLILFVYPYIIWACRYIRRCDMFEYISVKEAAAKWEISERRVQKLCEGNRIEGIE